MPDLAIYLIVLPIFAVVAIIGLGALSLLLRARWAAPEVRR